MLDLFLLVNLIRVEPLKLDPIASKLAQARAEYLCDHPFSHESFSMFSGANGGLVGENLAKGFPSDVEAFIALSQSKKHRSNMTNSLFTKTGIGRACGVVVQFFR